jgi:hypothetical protein
MILEGVEFAFAPEPLVHNCRIEVTGEERR